MLARLAAGLLLISIATGPAAAQTERPVVATATHAGVAYFLRPAVRQIDRFDLAAGQWLAPVPLTAAGTAMAVGDSGIFVGFGRRIARVAANGHEQHLQNTAGDVRDLVLAGPLVASLTATQALISLDSTTGAFLDASDGFYAYHGLTGLSAARSRRKVFARNTGLSPSDIVVTTLGPFGGIVSEADGPYHGDYPGASRTFVFPGDARVADDSGIVYTTNALTYAGSLGGRFDDLAFVGPLPIVLRGNVIVGYDAALREVGRALLPAPAHALAVHGELVYAFRIAGDIQVTAVPLATLGPLDPGEPIDPVGLAYTIDGAVQSNDGTIFLLSAGNLSVFRWLPGPRAYGPTIALADAPTYLAYSPVTNRLYLAYPSGRITHIRLDDGDDEEFLVNTPQAPCGLATAGEFVFVCDPSGAWGTHYTFTPEGAMLSAVDWNYHSREYVWDPARRRMYFFRDDTSPNDLHAEVIDAEGHIGAMLESPYHGDFPWRHPIRVVPGGDAILTGAGLFFDADTFEHSGSLANQIDDAAWLDGTLVTLRRVSPAPDPYEYDPPRFGVSQLQAWGDDTHPELWRRLVPGLPLRIFTGAPTAVAVTDVAGVPHWIPLTCGDGVVDPYEECDGGDLGGSSCQALGLGGGQLGCTAGCRVDAADCDVAPRCGDGVVNHLDEVCDGADFGVATGLATCEAFGFASGPLTCNADCTAFVTDACNACGNGVIDHSLGEQCDGADVGYGTCAGSGFPGGDIGCTSDCRLDTSTCHYDCEQNPCEDEDPCTLDTCSPEAGCGFEPMAGCTVVDGVLVTRATATIRRGDVVGTCAGRCGQRVRSAIVLQADGTYRVPSGSIECPGEQVAVPDEVGVLRAARRGREVAASTNIPEVLAATARCGGFGVKLRRASRWIRRSGDTIVDGRFLLVTRERRDGDVFNVERTMRFTGVGQELKVPRRFERLPDCANGLRLQCRAE